MAPDLGLGRSPGPGCDHGRFLALGDQRLAVRTLTSRFLVTLRSIVILRPGDARPQDFEICAAAWAWHLEHPDVGLPVALEHRRRLLENGRRSDHDFSISEGQGPALAQFERIALRADLHRVGFVAN